MIKYIYTYKLLWHYFIIVIFKGQCRQKYIKFINQRYLFFILIINWNNLKMPTKFWHNCALWILILTPLWRFVYLNFQLEFQNCHHNQVLSILLSNLSFNSVIFLSILLFNFLFYVSAPCQKCLLMLKYWPKWLTLNEGKVIIQKNKC